MITKNAPDKLIWTEAATTVFNKLKEALTKDSILISPRPDKEYSLSTDASTKGVGAVLTQKDDMGRDRPVAYFSRKLKPYQIHYTVTELELLALVLSIEHFSIYLLGTQFKVFTDHKALLQVAKLKTANGRLARWALFLQSYTSTIHYHPGKLNSDADALSRAEFPDSTQQPATPGGVV